MSIFDFFRPAWRHSNPDVRIAAVRSLSDEEVVVLNEVALRDSDSSVRRVAVKRLRDAEILKQVATDDADTDLRELASSRVSELAMRAALAASTAEGLTANQALELLVAERDFAQVAREAASEAVRKTALNKVSDQKLLVSVAVGATDPAIRKAAAAKVSDRAALVALARDSEEKGIAIGAVECIKDDEALVGLGKSAKLKAVRVAAQQRTGGREEKVAQVEMSPGEAKRLRQRLTHLCVTVEPYCKTSEDWEMVEGKLADASDRWAEIGSVPGDEPLRERFERAQAQFTARREAHAQETQRRLEASRVADERRQRAEEEAERRKTAKTEKVERESESVVPEVVAAAPVEAKAKTPEELERERLASERRTAERTALLAELAAAEQALIALSESEDLKKLGAAMKEARPFVKKAAASRDTEVQEARARLEERLGALSARFDSMKDAEDWKRWTNLPKVEQLIKEAEALVEVLDTVEDKRSVPTVLKELQARWKAAGPLPSKQSQVLWERFKKACDEAFAKCGEYFAQKDAERPENLKKKEAICEKAEALRESTDWKGTSDTLRALHDEWKTIGLVPDEQKELIWQRFRTACDAFYERRAANDKVRDEARGENLKVKQGLCAEAERLARSSDWRNTGERIKALQAEWKATGPVPREAGDDLWTRFRTACDQFFEARQAAFAAQDAERAENLSKKTKLCEEAEALAIRATDDGDRDAAQEETKELQRRWKTIGQVPREVVDEIWSRFRTACDKVFADPEAEALPPEVVNAGALGSSGFSNRLRLDGVIVANRGESASAAPSGETSTDVAPTTASK